MPFTFATGQVYKDNQGCMFFILGHFLLRLAYAVSAGGSIGSQVCPNESGVRHW